MIGPLVVFVLLAHVNGSIVWQPGRVYRDHATCELKAEYLNKLFKAETAFECKLSKVE